jgi:hypothetical protein
LSKYFLFPPALYEYRFFSMAGRLQEIQSYVWLMEFFMLVIVVPLGSEIIGISNLWRLRNDGYPFLLVACLLITSLLNLQSFFILAALYQARTK